MKMEKYYRLVSAMIIGFWAAGTAAGEYSFSTGAEYTEGDYGLESDTSALYVPFTIGYNADTFGWSVTVPYLSVTGTGEVAFSRTGIRVASQDTGSVTGSGSGPGGGSTTTTTTTVTDEHTESGMGDVTLSGTYRFLQGKGEQPSLAMTAKIKFATADEKKNLGTGENDYSLQVEAGLDSLYGYLGYLVIGDTAATDYDDIFFGAVGISKPLDTWSIGAEYYAEQAVLDGTDPVSEASVSLGRELGRDNWFNLYLIKGFTDSSPDWGAGVGFSHNF